MDHVFTYLRGALVVDIQLGGEPYRVERRLRDEDTGVGLYVIKRIDSDTEILRNGKLIDNPTCFRRYVLPVSGTA
ncbi:hypothetical protein IMCC9480_2621 [Oxalobacteraceae bacterium IMCC9480]|nr:hypothetical protein IMCC9480_2621 [Oxalobacteraceae bacterium IMCC9480]